MTDKSEWFSLLSAASHFWSFFPCIISFFRFVCFCVLLLESLIVLSFSWGFSNMNLIKEVMLRENVWPKVTHWMLELKGKLNVSLFSGAYPVSHTENSSPPYNNHVRWIQPRKRLCPKPVHWFGLEVMVGMGRTANMNGSSKEKGEKVGSWRNEFLMCGNQGNETRKGQNIQRGTYLQICKIWGENIAFFNLPTVLAANQK